MGQNYKEIAAIALKRREDAIPKDLLLPQAALANLPQNLTTVPKSSGHFTPEELEITESSAEDILAKIKNKTWTSLKVTKAFIKAAVVAQQLVGLPRKAVGTPLTNADKLLDRASHPRSSCQSKSAR